MSGLEVISGISAIITVLDTSIKVYDSARNDLKLHQTFESVQRRLPIILQILQTCKNGLEPGKDSMSSDVCEALEQILDSCSQKALRLREILETVIPGEKDTWEKRYAKVIRRLGRGNKVEELMASLTQDVQFIVNHHAVKSATPEQNCQLKNTLQEVESAKSLTTEEHSTLIFHSGGVQTNNVNSGSGQQINNNAPIGTQNFNSGKE
jgi:hypothetical protein